MYQKRVYQYHETCSRFYQSNYSKLKKKKIFQHLHEISWGLFQELPQRDNKPKVSFRKKIKKIFGAFNGVSVSDAEIVRDKEWKSYGLSFSLKNTPGVQSIVTAGSPPKKNHIRCTRHNLMY